MFYNIFIEDISEYIDVDGINIEKIRSGNSDIMSFEILWNKH